MKFFLSIIFFTISGFLFGELSFISGFLNDNYTGSTENGVSGRYIGADDFLTFSLFANSKKDRLGISEYYQVITSRAYGYRYDLLQTSVSYDFNLLDYNFSPYLSLLYKNDLGGEAIQNSIHDFRNLPPLVQTYSEAEIGLGIGVRAEYIYESILYREDKLKGLLHIDIPFVVKPLSSTLALEYFIDLNLVSFDIVGGYKQYITDVSGYSDFVRSGFIYGGQAIVHIYKGLTINAGAFFFPTRNLANDPTYITINHDYSPQFWVTLGFNGDNYGILDIINY